MESPSNAGLSVLKPNMMFDEMDEPSITPIGSSN